MNESIPASVASTQFQSRNLALSRNVLVMLAAIVLAGMGVRAWLMFSSSWVPGINGAYYLVQARALLERGVLGIPDMPLLFHLHAGLAYLLSAGFAESRDAAIVLAVKGCDSLLPPLAAIPVFVLTCRWAAHLGQTSKSVPLAAAALAALSSPLIGMVGDFQKNSLALVWLAALAATLHAWLERHDGRRGAALLTCLALLGLTHIGVLGTALLLLGAVATFWFALGGRVQASSVFWAAGGAVVVGLAAGLVLWRFDPARIHRLIGAVENPAGFASASPLPMPGGGGPGPALLSGLPFALFALAVIPSLWLVWRSRRSLPPADAAVAAGCAVLTLALTGPWFTFDKLMRFYSIALIPAIIAWAFALLRLETGYRRTAALRGTLFLLLAPTVFKLPAGGRAVLSEAALTELASLRPLISSPERTLIAAQHGPEWWTSWLLHTRIAQGSALKADDWSKFESVLFLEVKDGMQIGAFGGRGPRGGGRQPWKLPPGMPPTHPTGPPGTQKIPALMAAPIPADAQVLHDGAHLKLARVLAPPGFLTVKP